MRLKLNGTKILVAANQFPPYIETIYKPNTTLILSLQGFEGKIIQTLSECMNFSVEIVDCGMVWGDEQPDGSWNGLVGAVYERRADLAIGAITIAKKRSEVIQYSFPHYINPVTFSTPIPEWSGYSSSLLGPFEERIWFALLFSVLIVLFMAFMLNNYFKKHSNSALNIISIILGQPINSFESMVLSLRLLMLSWLLSVLVLKNYYCGELFGLMALNTEPNRIETISDFVDALKAGKLKIISLGKFSAIYMTKLKDLDLSLEESGKYKRVALDIDEYIYLTKTYPEKYSLLLDRNAIQFNIDLYNIQQCLPPEHKDSSIYLDLQAIILQKQSYLEYEINRRLTEMKEGGLIDLWNKHYFMNKFKKFYSEEIKNDNKFVKLNLNQMLYSFKTLTFGFCSSILLIIAEMVFKKTFHKTESNDYVFH